MKYSAFSANPLTQKGDCLVLGVFSEGKQGSVFDELDATLNGQLSRRLKSGDINGDSGKATWLHPEGGSFDRILLVGQGKADALDAAGFRKIARSVASALCASSAKTAILSLDAPASLPHPAFVSEALIMALAGASYRFEDYKSKKSPDLKLAQIKISLPEVSSKDAKAQVAQATAIAKGTAFTRDLGNQPGNICTPKYLAKQARKLAKEYDLNIDILGEKEMEKLGMGSFLSVSKGSEEEGQLIVMHYRGGQDKDPVHALVGKGITFDTGGISIKPGEAMDEMKYDMCGAASVFGTVTALAEMKAPINVVGIVAAAENMPSGKASKPGDIVKSLSGQTIEILNTDAEGRLVLCDALTYCERFKPASVVDIATLTGACIIALGHHACGMLANNDTLADELLAAGQMSGDRCWRLPLWPEYDEQINCNFADMQNIGGRAAGTITAAAFLARFTRDMNWAHLDIAGTAWLSGKEKGATGRPVPLLTRYLLNKLDRGAA